MTIYLDSFITPTVLPQHFPNATHLTRLPDFGQRAGDALHLALVPDQDALERLGADSIAGLR